MLADAAASCTKARLFFGVLQRLYTLFSGPTNRWNVLKERAHTYYCEALGRNQVGMRVESVKSVRYQLKDTAECLEKLSEISSNPTFCSECSSIQEEILSYEFILSLLLWYDILVKINLISKAWQKCNMQLDMALKHFDEFLCWLDDYRRNGFDSALVTAIEIADETDIPREFKQIRLRKKKIHFDYECPDETSANPADILRTEYFYVIVDMIRASAEPRFEGLKTDSTDFDFLYNISSLKNKADEELFLCCKELQVLLALSELQVLLALSES
jgi:hypothetical protein